MPRLPFEPPVESMRAGALPADDGYEPPFDMAQQEEHVRELYWASKELRGRCEDGAVRVAALGGGGMLYQGGQGQVMGCRCGQHPLGTRKGSPAAAECAAGRKAAAPGDELPA
jgi:hypothetical protein